MEVRRRDEPLCRVGSLVLRLPQFIFGHFAVIINPLIVSLQLSFITAE